MADRDEPFLSRWSRRKRGGGATPVVEAEPDSPPLAPATEAEQPPRENTAPVVAGEETPVDLPDIESLDKNSDYTGFLRDGVPEHLTRSALRKLWRSDPAFAVLDGLNDYDEDFSLAFTDAITKTVKTAYKVGKGWVDEDEKAAVEKVEGDSPAADEAGAGDTAPDESEVAGVTDTKITKDEQPT